MKALSVFAPYAVLISDGTKFLEFRSWKTKYRGDLIICSTADKELSDLLPVGQALCVVELVDVVPYSDEMEPQARLLFDITGEEFTEEDKPTGFAWVLENPRIIKPQKIKGQQRIFNLDIEPEFVDINPDNIYEYWEELGIITLSDD
ncbi:MAG: ASCH domain-containing protein [Clostridia bacterium]|nr:ASCH domain-containing protein [Clostridia bacterium]